MTSRNDTYTSPLAERNASAEMLRLWSPRHKFDTWRRIWLAVAEAQHELGLPVSAAQVEELRGVVERGISDAEMEAAGRYERELRHDVMAHVHALGDSCPLAKGIIHLGMTSQDVVCNADVAIVRESIRHVGLKLVKSIDALGFRADQWAVTPTIGFTHYQPAQPVTVGRRCAQWAFELDLTRRRLDDSRAMIQSKGLRGATGTQAAFAALAEGSTLAVTSAQRWHDTLDLWKRSPNFHELAPSSQYQYVNCVEYLIRDLTRLGRLPECVKGDAEGLTEAAGWNDRFSFSTVTTNRSQLRRFLSWCEDNCQSPHSPVEARQISPSMWTTLEASVQARLGDTLPAYGLTTQTYPRVIDTFILADLASTAAVLHKIATDIRLLCNRKELDEPFEDRQIGSSAMPYKRNPMQCERICGLTRFVMNLVGNAYDTAATQWLERTLDDSSNRRLSLPEAFLALDGALDLMHNVASGLIVHEAMVKRNLMAELPFLATENILMEAVKAGGDRQHYHEVIRRHAQAAGSRVKDEGLDNDLIERLRGDAAFHPPALKHELNWDGLLDPMKYIGRSVEQTERFIAEVVEPLRAQYGEAIAKLGESGPRV